MIIVLIRYGIGLKFHFLWASAFTIASRFNSFSADTKFEDQSCFSWKHLKLLMYRWLISIIDLRYFKLSRLHVHEMSNGESVLFSCIEWNTDVVDYLFPDLREI